MNENAAFIQNYSKGCLNNTTNSIKNEEIKKYSYKNFKEHVNIVGHISYKILYVCYSFAQFFALHSALVKAFHNDNIIIMLTSFVLGFIPFLGTLFGIYGAHVGWGWGLSHAVLIFFVIPYFIVNGPLLMIVCYDIYKDWKRWQTEKITDN